MDSGLSLQSANALRSAFRVEPELAEETRRTRGLGIYGWKTPAMDGFELPEAEELVLALHLGGSRRVRAITTQGLSPTYSAPGLLTVLPPGRSAAFRTDGSISLVSLHVAKSRLPARILEFVRSLAQPVNTRFAFSDTFVRSGMEALLRSAGSQRALDPDYFASVTDALLSHLAQTIAAPRPALHANAGADKPLGGITFAKLLAFIDAQLGDRIGLDELACATGLSRAAFTRQFKAAMGLSPHQYVNRRRVAAAEKMLRETRFDLAFIAQETGFSSQSHFTSIFRKQAGATPARFRNAH